MFMRTIFMTEEAPQNAEFKARVVLEALKGIKIVNQMTGQEGI